MRELRRERAAPKRRAIGASAGAARRDGDAAELAFVLRDLLGEGKLVAVETTSGRLLRLGRLR